MAKEADIYFTTDDWTIIEDDFDPQYALTAESVFSLGNEYMGVRGYFEEGYSAPERLVGSYINGVFDERKLEKSGYKGMLESTYFMINTVDYLHMRLAIDGETLDLNTSKFTKYQRMLDMRSGVLTRSFIWETAGGKRLSLCFERFTSMTAPHCAAQRLTVCALNFSGLLSVWAGLDFSLPHVSAKENLWECPHAFVEAKSCEILGRAKVSGHMVYSRCDFSGDICKAQHAQPYTTQIKQAVASYTMDIPQGVEATLTRVVQNHSCKDKSVATDEFLARARNAASIVPDYDALKANSLAWWNKAWEDSDIEIGGDALNQQGIRFCIFQLHQTYHGAKSGTVIGAKGLTGEFYNGNTFWDTEVYCLPFYIFNNPSAARNLLLFRYQTLPMAKERALALDCEGAFYPIATIDGRECCSLWQHASLQLQASTAVAYGIWHYVKLTEDNTFLYDYGAEMLVEICRMLATRGSWGSLNHQYGFYGVMGPDEFQMMVNNNCYTNYFAKKIFEYTLSVLDQMRGCAATKHEKLILKVLLREEELFIWRNMSDNMYIPYCEETKLFEQNDGFFNMPDIDIGSIPTSDFPLYHHWSYDRIYRNNMIKQPDVLMMMLLYNCEFTKEQKRTNYEYYEPHCIHESSLSPSVHSILASELNKHDEAYRFFGFATRMDLDNFNRNTAEGLHTTSIAAAWMNVVYGLGGMRSDAAILSFEPSIPREWNRFSFRVACRGDRLCVEVDKESVRLKTLGGSRVCVKLYGNETAVDGNGIEIPLPAERRG